MQAAPTPVAEPLTPPSRRRPSAAGGCWPATSPSWPSSSAPTSGASTSYTPHYERHLAAPARRVVHAARARHRRLQEASQQRCLDEDVALVLPQGAHRRPRHRGQVVARRGATSTPTSATRPTPEILQRIIEEQGAPLVVIDDGSHIPAHVRESFRILFPLLPDGAIYCIEDTQTSYWPAWGGAARPAGARHVDGPGQGPRRRPQPRGVPRRGLRADATPTSGCRAVHCYHNLVDHREGRQPRGHQPRHTPRTPSTAPRELPRRPHDASCSPPAPTCPTASPVRAPSTRRCPLAASTSPGCRGTTRRSTGPPPRSSRSGPPGTTSRPRTPSSSPGRRRSTSRACSTVPTSSPGTTTSATSPSSATCRRCPTLTRRRPRRAGRRRRRLRHRRREAARRRRRSRADRGHRPRGPPAGQTRAQPRRLSRRSADPGSSQPLVESIRTRGEVSVYVLDGRWLTSVRQAARRAATYASTRSSAARCAPAAMGDVGDLVMTAYDAMAASASAGRSTTSASTSCSGTAQWVVSELELIEPGLYLDVSAGQRGALRRPVVAITDSQTGTRPSRAADPG